MIQLYPHFLVRFLARFAIWHQRRRSFRLPDKPTNRRNVERLLLNDD